MIVAVDFDVCLSLGTRYPSLGRPNLALIQCLDQLHELGHTIILWTCREGPELEDAVTWCKDYHVPIDYVNENPPWVGFKSRKVVADWYIDDRMLGGTIDWEWIEKQLCKDKDDDKTGSK